jgi:sec-independent protein translocase protein TatA
MTAGVTPSHVIPLFPGVPGGPELLVVLLLMIALFGLPVVIAVLGWQYLRGDRDGDRVAELEARVRELEAELADGDEDDERSRGRRPDDVGSDRDPEARSE